LYLPGHAFSSLATPLLRSGAQPIFESSPLWIPGQGHNPNLAK
jgi:hypothetical protein